MNTIQAVHLMSLEKASHLYAGETLYFGEDNIPLAFFKQQRGQR